MDQWLGTNFVKKPVSLSFKNIPQKQFLIGHSVANMYYAIITSRNYLFQDNQIKKHFPQVPNDLTKRGLTKHMGLQVKG